MSDDIHDLIDAVAAASLLGIEPSTLGHWRTTPGRQRQLPFHRIGGRVRYLRSDVLAFLAAGRVTPSMTPTKHDGDAK